MDRDLEAWDRDRALDQGFLRLEDAHEYSMRAFWRGAVIFGCISFFSGWLFGWLTH